MACSWSRGALLQERARAEVDESCIFEERNRHSGLIVARQKPFQPSNSFRCEQDVTANGAHLSRNVVDDHDPPADARGVDHFSFFVLPRASANGALHEVILLRVGATHFGGLGKYAVMIISIGWSVVHTTWIGR